MKKIFLIFFLLNWNVMAQVIPEESVSGGTSLTVFNDGELISSEKFNERISSLNEGLTQKGFTERFRSIEKGEGFNLEALNNIFKSINPLIYRGAEVQDIDANVGDVISASLLNNKFVEVSELISPLTCRTNLYTLSTRYNRGERDLYTFLEDYSSVDSSMGVVFSRGWPEITGYGWLRVISPEGDILWAQTFNLGKSSGSSKSVSYVVPQEFYRKGNKIRSRLDSNNSESRHASTNVNFNLQYICP